jgi:hypothetical protein
MEEARPAVKNQAHFLLKVFQKSTDKESNREKGQPWGWQIRAVK